MKISYFFPIFCDTDARVFFEEFSKSDFYKRYPERQIVFACQKNDEKNIEYLKTLPNVTTNIFEEKFGYTDAFKSCLSLFDGDVLLLGDPALCGIDTVFDLCVREHEAGADIVHLRKKFGKTKGFFANLWSNCSRIFSSLVASQKDSGNVLSLGLYSRDVVEILQTLPEKSCLLKNADDLVGFKSKTIFVDGTSETYSPEYSAKSSALTWAVVSNVIFLASIAAMITLDILLPGYQLISTLVCVFFMLVSLAVCLLMIFKHFFDLRNTGKTLPFLTLSENEENVNKPAKTSSKKPSNVTKTNKNDTKAATESKKSSKNTSTDENSSQKTSKVALTGENSSKTTSKNKSTNKNDAKGATTNKKNK